MPDRSNMPKPQTTSDKKLSLKHSKESLALSKKHKREHQAAKPSPYNAAHVKDHTKEIQHIQKRVAVKQKAVRSSGRRSR